MVQTDPGAGLPSNVLALWDQLQQELASEVAREKKKTANLASKIENVEEERAELAETVRKQKLESDHKDQMVSRLEKERDKISLQLSIRNSFVANQAKILREQVNSLANDAHARRISKITELYPPYVVSDTQPHLCIFKFSNPVHVTELLQIKTTLTRSLFFYASPPRALPIYLSGMGHSGYWFDPRDVPKSEFDPFVETSIDEWKYYGRFTTKNLDLGAYMEVAEWLSIDEITRRTYVTEASSRGPTSGQVPTPEQINTLMHQLDSGEKIVPCYLLRWVGYSTDLCKALTDVTNTLMPRHESRNSSKRSESGTKNVQQTGNQIRKKPRLTASSGPPSDSKENTKLLL